MKRLLLSITILSFLSIASENVDAQPLPPGNTLPVITEIMYNPPESGNDTLEFIELYNPSTTAAINLSGYTFSSGIEYTFPAGIVMAPGSYVLISGDSVVFEEWYGLEAYEWTGGTALSNDGEGLTIRNASGAVADTVFFDDTNAWADADGTGFSLVLCDPTADNNLPENWTLSENATGIIVATTPDPTEIFADPGAASTCTPTGIFNDNVITTFIYPNPSNGEFRLQMEPLNESATLKIFSNTGQLVTTRSLSEGTTSVLMTESLSTGYYTLAVEKARSIERIKLIIE